jgi:hypothetical protein
VLRTKGVITAMPAPKNVSPTTEPLRTRDQAATEDNHYRYTSDTYQKVLDYHVAEILLSTIVLAVITLLRLHH